MIISLNVMVGLGAVFSTPRDSGVQLEEVSYSRGQVERVHTITLDLNEVISLRMIPIFILYE